MKTPMKLRLSRFVARPNLAASVRILRGGHAQGTVSLTPGMCLQLAGRGRVQRSLVLGKM